MGLLEDARNIQRKDPAARNVLEVILLYPGFTFWYTTAWRTGYTSTSGSFWPGGSASTDAAAPASRSTRCHHRQMPVYRPRHGHRVR